MKEFKVNLSERDFYTFSDIIDNYHEKCFNEIIDNLKEIKDQFNKKRDNKFTTNSNYKDKNF